MVGAGSVVLVIGANRGFGASLCAALLERGASKVYGGSRDVSAVQMAGVEPVQLDMATAGRPFHSPQAASKASVTGPPDHC